MIFVKLSNSKTVTSLPSLLAVTWSVKGHTSHSVMTFNELSENKQRRKD